MNFFTTQFSTALNTAECVNNEPATCFLVDADGSDQVRMALNASSIIAQTVFDRRKMHIAPILQSLVGYRLKR